MTYRLLGLLTWGLLGLGACGGGGMAADGGGGAAGGIAGGGGASAGSGGTGVGGGGFFITGTVDGVVRRVESNLDAGTDGLLDANSIWLVATGTPASWTIYVQNRITTHDCGFAFIMLSDDMGAVSDQFPTSCSVTITSAAPNVGDIVAGTFTATLAAGGSQVRTATVTDGAFRVMRNNP